MNLQAFLAWLGTGAGCGAAVWALVALAGKLAPDPLPARVKFYGALALCVVLPLGALAGEVALGWATWSPEALFQAGLISWLVSQTVHLEVQAAADRAAVRAAERALRAQPPNR